MLLRPLAPTRDPRVWRALRTRGTGEPGFYPFVLFGPAVRQPHFVHKVVKEAGGLARGGSPTGAGGVALGDGSPTGAGGGAIGGDSAGAGGAAGGRPVSGGTGTLPPPPRVGTPLVARAPARPAPGG